MIMRSHKIYNKKQRDRNYKEKEPNGNSGIEIFNWKEKFTCGAQ